MPPSAAPFDTARLSLLCHSLRRHFPTLQGANHAFSLESDDSSAFRHLQHALRRVSPQRQWRARCATSNMRHFLDVAKVKNRHSARHFQWPRGTRNHKAQIFRPLRGPSLYAFRFTFWTFFFGRRGPERLEKQHGFAGKVWFRTPRIPLHVDPARIFFGKIPLEYARSEERARNFNGRPRTAKMATQP